MAEETIYLCNFRVSVDGDWLCLRELSDVQLHVNDDDLTSPVLTPVSPDDGENTTDSITVRPTCG